MAYFVMKAYIVEINNACIPMHSKTFNCHPTNVSNDIIHLVFKVELDEIYVKVSLKICTQLVQIVVMHA